jgi:hypothetical protein
VRHPDFTDITGRRVDVIAGRRIPWPYARVLNGSTVVHHSFGVTRPHAVGRAARWAQRRGASGVRITD